MQPPTDPGPAVWPADGAEYDSEYFRESPPSHIRDPFAANRPEIPERAKGERTSSPRRSLIVTVVWLIVIGNILNTANAIMDSAKVGWAPRALVFGSVLLYLGFDLLWARRLGYSDGPRVDRADIGRICVRAGTVLAFAGSLIVIAVRYL